MTRHVPGLDGLRGVAILLVLLSHTAILLPAGRIDLLYDFWAHFGWTGVNLFFVLSGYLITSILWSAKDGPHFFRNFWARRVLRIFPLYYLVLFMFFVVGRHVGAGFLLPVGIAAGNEAWYWLYLSNVSMALHKDFAPLSLGVSWSLAIEEQFYLLWPPVVYLLGRRSLVTVCAVLFVGALAFRTVLVLLHVNPLSIYVLLPAHMDGLALGGLLALTSVTDRGRALLRRAAPWALLLAGPIVIGIAATSTHFDYVDPTMETIGFTMMNIVYGSILVIVAVAGEDTALGRLMAGGPLRTFGRYSYAMYLLHRPVLRAIQLAFPALLVAPPLLHSRLYAQLAFTLASIGLTLMLAWLSWHLFEEHFLKLKRFFVLSEGPSKAVTHLHAIDAPR